MNILKLLTTLLIAATAHGALAQDTYPARAVRLIVPYPPGNATDAGARIIAAYFTKAFGQSFFVDNRGGAAGAIGMAAAAQAAPDGYTLAMGTSATQAMNPHLFKALSDPPQFDPVGLVVKVPLVISVAPEFAARSLPELFAAARNLPQGLSIAFAGSANQVMVEVLRERSGAPLVGVPYKGSPEAITDVIGGRVPALVDGVTSSRPMANSGRLRPIAITTAQQSDLMPGLKTVAEQGFAGFELTAWNVLLAPKGTPTAVLQRLNAQLGRTLAEAQVRRELLDAGLEAAHAGAPERTSEFLRNELRRWGELIKLAKVPQQ